MPVMEMEREQDEVEQEMELESPEKKKQKKRLLLNPDNKYLFETGEEAKMGLDLLIYTDGSSVEGYRVWTIASPEEGEDAVYILSRNREGASWTLLEDLGYDIGLTYPGHRGGPGRARKIDPFYIPFGKLLAKVIFVDPEHPGTSKMKKNPDPDYLAQWNEKFGVGSVCAHYFETDGSFKSPPEKK